MSTVQLIDSHVHVWDPAVLPYSWLRGDEAMNRPFLPDQLHEDDPGITQCVFVQADADPGHSLREASWVNSLVPAWQELAGIVAHAPLERATDRGPILDSLGELSNVVGIRRLLQDASDDFIRSDSLAAGLREITRRGLTFDACPRHYQLEALNDMIAQTPSVAVVLDHLGKPPIALGIDSSAGQTWLRNIELIARWPQVTIKLSGLPAEAVKGRPVAEQAIPFLTAALEQFGTNRAMIGSDWPVSAVTDHRLSRTSWFAIVLDELGLSPTEQEDVAWRTAARFYGLPTHHTSTERQNNADRHIRR